MKEKSIQELKELTEKELQKVSGGALDQRVINAAVLANDGGGLVSKLAAKYPTGYPQRHWYTITNLMWNFMGCLGTSDYEGMRQCLRDAIASLDAVSAFVSDPDVQTAKGKFEAAIAALSTL